MHPVCRSDLYLRNITEMNVWDLIGGTHIRTDNTEGREAI